MATKVPKALASFFVRLPVQWGHMDAFQHVNNVQYLQKTSVQYTESARLSFMEMLLEKCTDEKLKREFSSGKGVGPILAKQECTYKYPMTYPDTVKIYTGLTDIQKDRFTVEYILQSEKTGRIVATSSSLIVTYDYAKNQKVEIPPAIRSIMEIITDEE